MLLALDTATQNASVALYDAARVWAEYTWFSARNHTVELMPIVADMLRRLGRTARDLRGVAVAMGPGSFTGMRIGLSAAKGFGLALEIPVIGVPTLDIVAQPHCASRLPVCAVVHAGRGRFATALYRRQRGKWGRQSDYRLATPANLAEGLASETLFCGELDDEARQAIRGALGDQALFVAPAQAMRRATVLAELAWERVLAGRGDDLATLAPIYLHTLGKDDA